MRRWIVRSALLGVALASVLALTLVTALAVLDDDDYKAALIWAADNYFDARLAIDGEFSVGVGQTIALRMQGMALQTHDGRLTASVTDLGTELQVRRLLSKTLWLESLTIVGARFDVERSAGPDTGVRAAMDGDLPNIIVAQARLLDVAIAYRDAAGGMHEAQIDQLQIEDPLDDGPISVKGRGQLDGRLIEVAGTLGPRSLLTDISVPYPVDLTVRSDALSIALKGTIDDPTTGRGVDLQARAEDPDLAGSLALLGQSTPPLGALTLETGISGDYDALALQQMTLSLKTADQVDIQITGRIGNLQALSGVDLSVTGKIDDAEVWQWLTVGRLPGFHGAEFSGALSGNKADLRISRLDLKTTAADSLALGLKGSLGLDLASRSLSESAVDLALELSAPRLAAFDPLADRELPALGPVGLSARLTGSGAMLRFEGLDATIGAEPDHHFVFTDGSGELDLRNPRVLRSARLPMRASTPRPAGLARLLKRDIPELGPTRVTGTWTVDDETITFAAFESTIELGDGSTHRLTGDIQHRVGETTTADIRFDLDTDRLLAMWLDDRPGELGRIAGMISLRGDNTDWQARRFELASTQTDQFSVAVTGQDGSLASGGRQQMTLRLSIDDPPRLFETAGLELPPSAPIEAGGTLTLDQGRHHFAGDLRVGTTASRLDITARLHKGRPTINGELMTSRLALADFGLPVDETPATQANGVGPEADTDTAEASPKDQPLFSRAPYDLAWLRTIDLDLAVSIDELRGVELEIDDLAGRINLTSGYLRLSQADFQYLGGKASGTYELDARATPMLKVDIKADDLILSDILGEFLTDTFEGGVLDLELKLEGRGSNPHELAASLDGGLDMAFEKTSMPADYLQFLSADVFGWTLSKTALADRRSFIDCGVVGLDAESGIVTSRALLADGRELSLSGDIQMDLGAETLDMVVLPKQKSAATAFSKATPVKLSGNLRDPTVEAIPAKAAAQRVGGLLLLPQVFIPLEVVSQVGRLFSRGTQSSDGCTDVLGRSVEAGFAFEGVEPPTTSRPDD